MLVSFNSFNKIPFASKKVKPSYSKEGGVRSFEENKSITKPIKIIDKKEIKSEDTKKIDFKTLDEAHDYFLEEYGIDAEFKNFFQAQITKEAVDSFAELNYKGKGKKLFEGLKINSNLESKSAYAAMCYKIEKDGKEFKKDTQAEEYGFIRKDESIVATNAHISLNPSYDVWMQTEMGTNRFAATTYKNFITHELTHWLHATKNPHGYLLAAYKRPIGEQKELIKEVSHYASKNMAEFVAEYAVARLEGRTFPKEINELYQEFYGPDLFED